MGQIQIQYDNKTQMFSIKKKSIIQILFEARLGLHQDKETMTSQAAEPRLTSAQDALCKRYSILVC